MKANELLSVKMEEKLECGYVVEMGEESRM